jgi:hypothetical protein
LGRPVWGRAKAAPDAIEKDAARPVARRAGVVPTGRRIRPTSGATVRRPGGSVHLPGGHSSGVRALVRGKAKAAPGGCWSAATEEYKGAEIPGPRPLNCGARWAG